MIFTFVEPLKSHSKSPLHVVVNLRENDCVYDTLKEIEAQYWLQKN